MSHADEGLLHAYLDGELPAAERTALDAHLAECAACRARLGEERALLERASALLGSVTPDVRPARRPLLWRVRVPLAWAASVVLAVLVGYNAGGRGSVGSEEQATPSELFQLTERAPYDLAKRPPSADSIAAPAPEPQRTAERTDRDARAERDELSTPSAGVVPIQPQGELRVSERAPTPALAPSIVVAERNAAPSGVADLRGRQVATEWPIIRQGSARSLLGSDPVGVPGLAVREIRRSPESDGTVLVEQQLDSMTVIQLFQRPAALEQQERVERPQAAARAQNRAVLDRLARYVGGLRVEIAGPLSQDSLNRLLEQVKPLP